MANVPITRGASPSLATTGAAKPVRLRSACNHCFTAKVKCDGNKQGCRRCGEKRLDCAYSESRVGKVVGRRRKRLMDDAIGMVNSEAWVINQYLPNQSTTSPATTNSSLECGRSQQPNYNWTSLVGSDEHEILTLDEPVDFQKLDLTDCHSFSVPRETMFLDHSSLSTPSLSPPQLMYFSPAASNHQQIAMPRPEMTVNTWLRPSHHTTSAKQTPEPTQSDDEETVCIKILAHLKKYTMQHEGDRLAQIDLLNKTNAAVKRILRSRNTSPNYTCQILLSSILIYVVQVCEVTCRMDQDDFVQSVPLLLQEPFDSFNISHSMSGQPSNVNMKLIIFETLELAAAVGELLKKKPAGGFQTIGRHESLHIALDQRLRKAFAGI